MQCDESVLRNTTVKPLDLPELSKRISTNTLKYSINLKKLNERTQASTSTRIMPNGVILSETVQGIVLYPKLSQQALANNQSFQEYMASDTFFRNYLIADIDPEISQWLVSFLFSINTKDIDLTCQYLNLYIYQKLSSWMKDKSRRGNFDFYFIKDMNDKRSLGYRQIFQSHIPDVYQDSTKNKIFNAIVVNWLKEKFFMKWIVKAFSQIRDQIHTSVQIGESNLVPNEDIILNDNDVNKIFGWSLFKTRKKYTRRSRKGCDEPLNDQYCNILEDMCVTTEDIIENRTYVQMYYPANEMLRDRGGLTLINPDYCPHFSKLLLLINQARQVGYDVDRGSILDKEAMIKSVSD